MESIQNRICRLACAFAATALLLATPARAASPSDLVGVYQVAVASLSGSCPPTQGTNFDVQSVSGNQIVIAFNGPPTPATFDAAAESFVLDYPMGGDNHIVLNGQFSRRADAIVLDATFTWPAIMGGCVSHLSGSRPFTAAVSPSESVTTTAPQAVPPPTLLGVANPEPQPPVPDDGVDVMPILLLLLLLLLALLGAVFYVRRQRQMTGPGGKLGLIVPSVVSGAVGSDRYGGFEDQLTYGDGAGKAAPHSEKAYEALLVAQHQKTEKEKREEHLINPTGTLAESAEKRGESGDEERPAARPKAIEPPPPPPPPKKKRDPGPPV